MHSLEQAENKIYLPHLDLSEVESLKDELKARKIQGHVVLSSSGTTSGNWKAYLISQKSLIKNAEAVNQRLELGADDKWGLTLPEYHIGGLSIHYRAQLLGHTPVNLRPWSAESLVSQIRQHQVTVISLVPTQVYDLVRIKAQAPQGLKVVLVGGDYLSNELEKRFLSLGWPLLRTYGMTEVCSQLCTGVNDLGDYAPLSIHELKVDSDEYLHVKSQSFFSALISKGPSWNFMFLEELTDQEGFLKIPDKARIRSGHVQLLGREDGQIKIAGHLVNLLALREILEKITLENGYWGSMELSLEKSEREGHALVLNCLAGVPEELIERFRESISPIKVTHVVKHSQLPRTDLGKFIKQTPPLKKQDNYGN